MLSIIIIRLVLLHDKNQMQTKLSLSVDIVHNTLEHENRDS